MSGYRPEGLHDTFVPEQDADAAEPVLPAQDGAGEPAEAPAPGSPTLPSLGPVGWLRWAWRQLTSMRVALLLLVLLAVAAVPGTLVPQRAQSPEKVATFLTDHPALGPFLDRIGMFDTYTSVWFSAIYLLLFVSLVGCILPRTRAHVAALRGRPPRTPRRLTRFPAQGTGTSGDQPQVVVERAARVLRRGRWLPFWPAYRVDVHDEGAGTWSVSAERGYLRETGNLLFHLALVGLLVSVATGQVLHYRGQVLVVQGHGFANAEVAYSPFEHGRFYSSSSLVPFTLKLDQLDARFDPETDAARDFTAHVTVTAPGGGSSTDTIKVNHPLMVGGANVYLMGNGYAPDVTVKDASGSVAFAGPVPFLPQDTVYTSRGVIKVPDVSGGQKQIGLVGFLLPTGKEVAPGVWRSVSPQSDDPVLVLSVWSGNLGLDTGVPQNVYLLDQSRMTQSVDSTGKPVTLYVHPGQTVQLPDGLGSFTFNGLPRYVALDLRHDPALAFVLAFALLALAGLAASLFAPRRRIWLRAAQDQGPTTVVGAAGLARGDDIGLQPELDRVLAATLGRHEGPGEDTP
ncbi:cytochrome c biogenesis protein ResB [Cellulomonas sp. NTE-D12]|uniref:cytochrome c biogenesis protein ResB n=1 Tax=Cellulomonas sp. NTE-D12 TaxID=2962632 RepID=UPI0030819421|nr:cytochrome c biogenesis protein ResB [Cellulomonas sp. NTE-D12]